MKQGTFFLMLAMTGFRLAGPADVETTRRVITTTLLSDSVLTDENEHASIHSTPAMGVAPWRVERHAEKERIILGLYRGPWYDRVFVATLKATDEFKHVAYIAQNGAKTFVVVDHREEPPFDGIGGDAIHLSPDGSQVAYPVRLSLAKTILVRNGEELPESELYNGSFVFSPNGRRYAYPILAKNAEEARLYCDGEMVAVHKAAAVSHLVFSPDSEHLLYVLHEIKESGKQRVVIHNQRGPLFDAIRWAYPGGDQVFFFSPDRKRVAYVGQKDGKDLLVVDQRIESLLEDVRIVDVLFSADSKRIALITADRENSEWFAMYGGKSAPLPVGYPIRRDLIFSSDGEHLAQVQQVEGGYMVMVDAIPGPIFASIEAVMFLDGDRIRYVARYVSSGLKHVVEEQISR